MKTWKLQIGFTGCDDIVSVVLYDNHGRIREDWYRKDQHQHGGGAFADLVYDSWYQQAHAKTLYFRIMLSAKQMADAS